MPSTARPSHLGGRASGTWPDKEKSESGDEIDKRSAAFPLRCLRGALHLWRCLSEVYFRSRADVSLCALPLSSSNPPPSPFASYLSCVCLAGGNKRLHREAAPAGVLTGIKILPYERGQRTREGNFSQLRDKFSRSDSLKDKRVDGWGVIAGERQR